MYSPSPQEVAIASSPTKKDRCNALAKVHGSGRTSNPARRPALAVFAGALVVLRVDERMLDTRSPAV